MTRRAAPLRPAQWALAAALVFAGAWLRIRGAQGEMWLDEVWSLNIAKDLTAWHQALWAVFNDNSHPLNTTYLHLVGPDAEPWAYRLLSILAGTAGVAAVGLLMRRSGAAAMFLAMLLAATLFPLVNFGSEARGYALMALCAYAVFAIVDADPPARKARWAFTAAVVLGAWSHLTIIPIAAVLALAYGMRRRQAGRGWFDALGDVVRLTAPTAGFLSLYILAFLYTIRRPGAMVEFGGTTLHCGPGGCFVTALDAMARFCSGGFGESAVPGIFTAAFLALTWGCVTYLYREKHARRHLYAAVFVGAPLLFLAMTQVSTQHAARYFLGIVAFLPLLLAEVVTALRYRGRIPRLTAGIAVLALVTANLWAFSQFQKTGRGDYAAALATLTADRQTGPLIVGTDMEWQLQTVLNHTARRLGPDLEIRYAPSPLKTVARPPWLVLVKRKPWNLPADLCLDDGARYERKSLHVYWGMSGTHWGVYRLSDAGCP
ncbi:MAG: hypothetical protein HQL36_02200 [Alphaproteobacteria bacterium]|nr:hypothetical protein [Alphaproteobacteria bacterium]